MKTRPFSIFKWTMIFSIALLASSLQPGSAATLTWDAGGGSPYSWSEGNNWLSNNPPSAGDDLIFSGTLGTTNLNNLTGNPTYASLTFSGSSAWMLSNGTSASANAFQVSGGINLIGTGSVTIQSNLTLTASQSIVNSSTNSRTLSLAGNLAIGGNTLTVNTAPASGTGENNVNLTGTLSGVGGSIIKDGIGTLTLQSNGNSFTGNIQINAGTLVAYNGTSLGAGAGTTTVASGAALRLTGGGGSISENITLSGEGATSGGGNLQRGALAVFSNFGAFNLTGSVTLAGNSSIGMRAFTNVLTISGAVGESITGAGLNKVGSWGDPNAGFLKLSGANTYTGQTTVTGGGLVVNGSHGAATSEATRVGNYNITFETLSAAQTGTATALTSQSVLAGTGTLYLKNSAVVNLAGASSSLLASLAPGDVTATTSVTSFTSTIGTLVINAATHAPGSAAVVFGANSQLSIQIDSTKAGGTAGASDLLSVIGGHIDLTGSNDYLVLNLLGAGTLSGDYVIATFASMSPALYGTFDYVIGLPSGYQLYYNATNLTLGVAAVPEPGTVGLLGVTVLAFFSARRLRRKTASL